MTDTIESLAGELAAAFERRERDEGGLVDGSDVNRAIRVGILMEQYEVLQELYDFLDNLADEDEGEE